VGVINGINGFPYLCTLPYSFILILVSVIFWVSFLCLLHTYVLFPALLSSLAKNKKQNEITFNSSDSDLPTISILFAAFNEEKLIGRKIDSTFQTNYPKHKIELLVGSDASTDNTNQIIEEKEKLHPQLKFVPFPERTGKVRIVNELAKMASGNILILTDANVFFSEDTLFQLVKHYKNKNIGLTGGNIQNVRFRKDGISYPEKKYLSRENEMKYQEGLIWGSMIGAFGGCYSIRKSLWTDVPPHFIVDDFFISMRVLEQGKQAINELNAICYEDVSNRITEEFRRKVRISIGNFQNLGRFKSLLWPLWSSLSFAFLGHKALRWLGPIFIILMLLSSWILGLVYQPFYLLLFKLQLILLLIPFLDYLLKKVHIHILFLRFVSHFYLMNLALLIGLFKYLRGVESSIWRPTERE